MLAERNCFGLAEKKTGVTERSRLWFPTESGANYFLLFLPPEVGTVAMVCKMRPAIL